MENKRLRFLSRRQLTAIAWVAILSPAVRQLPRSTVHMGGAAAWLAPLLAFLPLLLLLRLTGGLLRGREEGEGLSGVFCRILGQRGGRLALLFYSLWILAYAGFVLRAGADRFVTAVYPDSGPAVFVLVLAGLGLMAGLGRLKTLGRCAEVTKPFLLFILLLLLGLALSRVEAASLLPLGVPELLGAGRAVLPVVNTLSLLGAAAFLEQETEPAPLCSSLRGSLAGLLLLLTLLGLCTVGSFGAEMLSHMQHPFFVMIRDVSFFRFLDRIEALVIVQWVLTDFVLFSLLLHAASLNLSFLFPGSRPLWGALSAGAALGATLLWGRSSFELQHFAEHLVPQLNGLFYALGFPLLFLLGKLRKKI